MEAAEQNKLIEQHPILADLKEAKEIVWINPDKVITAEGLARSPLGMADIDDAEARLKRFAPFIERCFPETRERHGLIESLLKPIPGMKARINERYGSNLKGDLLLKMDSHLAIAGSVKARGGIYEVLKHTEDLALEHGLLKEGDSYAKLADPKCREFFSQYKIQVGSTGNLGMSIGIMSAAVGFTVIVHMSADAKQWKKDLLRSHGVTVMEYESDYSEAVKNGRKLSDEDPKSYFVDDEKSVNLFLGYAVAAGRLKKQFEEQGVVVDEEHPLIVYIPAGVGGAPGGVSYGLKRLYGDLVHCFFVEPVECPSVMLGIATQKFEHANVRDYGMTGKTEADGLACASPSSFVTRIMTNLLSGGFTVNDNKLYDFLRLLYKTEEEQIEPSSCATFIGPVRLLEEEETKAYCKKHALTEKILKNATQIVWATGGRLVPDEIRKEYLEKHL